METKDKKNNPVVDEEVNVENGTIANEVTPETAKKKKGESLLEKAEDVVKIAQKVTSGATDVAGKVAGVTKTVGKVAGGVAKSAGLFTNISSFIIANLQTILIAGAISAAIGFVGYIVVDMFAKPQIEDTANIVEEVKKISELTTACFYEESVIQSAKTTTKKHWYGEAIDTVKHEIVITALCKVRAGFDLSMLADGDLVIKGDTVDVKLPAPKIFDVISNPSDYKIFEEIGEWSHNEIVAMQVEKKEKVLQSALDHNILEKANHIGKGRVVTLFQCLGFNVVNVTLSDIPVREQAPEVAPVAKAVVEQVEAPAVDEVVETAPAVEATPVVDTVAVVVEEQVAA